MRQSVKGLILLAEDGRPIPEVIVDIYEFNSETTVTAANITKGDLLGSIITNNEGSFGLEWDDTEVLRHTNNHNSNSVLIAAVFVDKVVEGVLPPKRILLAASSPRPNALIIDSFIVRVPKKQLKASGIRLPRVREIPDVVIGDAIESLIESRKEEIKSLKKSTKNILKERIAVKKEGHKFVKNFLGKKPLQRRLAPNLFIPAGDDPKETLETVMSLGLGKLERSEPIGVKIRKGHNLGEEVENAIEDALENGGQISAELAEKIHNSVRSSAKFTRWKDLLTECKAEKEAEIAAQEAKAKAEAEELSSAEGESTVAAIEIEIDAETEGNGTEGNGTYENGTEYQDALNQVLKLIRARTDVAIGVRPNMETIAKNIEEKIPLGPADTEAYYDFHSLEVAWQDTWTAAIDSMAAEDVAELYESVVEVIDADVFMDESNGLGAVRIMGKTPANLKAATMEIKNIVNTAASTPGHEVPPELVAWRPKLKSVWKKLPPQLQKQIRQLYENYVNSIKLQNEKDIFKQGEIIAKMTKAVDLFVNPGFIPELLIKIVFPREFRKLILKLADAIINSVEIIDDVVELIEEGVDEVKKVVNKNLYSNKNNYQVSSAASKTNKQKKEESKQLPPSLGRAEALLAGIEERLSEPHQFDIFVPDSYNFGVLSTYRQKWKPLTYQVGNLVSSMPLAPSETRSFTKKQVVKTSRSQKEIENSLSTHKSDSSVTGRAESEIINKLNSKTDFKTTGEAGGDIKMVSYKVTGEVAGERGSDSANTKNNFREAVRSAAQEYSNERKLEITTERTVTGESVEEGEISNPNNELTVTYLFYELQRRFEISEKLHELTPVVMVAYDVPSPDEIDEDWLLAYSWILKRVILDDSFLKGLSYISETFTGDEVGVDILRRQWEEQMTIVAAIKDNVSAQSTLRDAARESMRDVTEEVAREKGLFRSVHEALNGSFVADEKDVLAARTESQQMGLEWARSDYASSVSQLQSATNSLRQATNDYISGLKTQLNRRTAIDQVRIHIKENILHYMQAIWSHEHSDQRYFRLYDLELKWPEVDKDTYIIARATKQKPKIPFPMQFKFKDPEYVLQLPKAKLGGTKLLHEVADLNRLMGFKGNYAIFPLTESNAITDYMSMDFLDNYFGVDDLDPFSTIMPRSEALELVECAWNKPETKDEDRIKLTEWLMETLANQKRVTDEIIVPTGQLYIEALPGSTPILEDFKLQHRKIDVQKAESELDLQLLEALRRVARLSSNDLSDPDIDKNIRIDGERSNLTIPTE